MNAAPAQPPVPKWTWGRWLAAIFIVFVLHLALVFIFGAKKSSPVRSIENDISLKLVAGTPETWQALNNAAMFALPERNGFADQMWVMLPLPFHLPDWTEPPRWLAATDSLPVAQWGTTFNHFIQTNHFASVHLEYNITPQLSTPPAPFELPFAQSSSLQMQGGISRRKLLTVLKLPSWPNADVIAPSMVQVVVNAAGDVISAALLPPENAMENSAVQDADANQYAVGLARTFRFAPAASQNGGIQPLSEAKLTVGEIIFDWQTIPPTSTNLIQ